MTLSKQSQTIQILAKSVFIAYALALSTGTHWPRLDLSKVGLSLNDKMVHFGAFTFFALLLACSGWVKEKESMKRARKCLLIACIYATVDELTQGAPIIHRQVDALDLLANMLGSLFGCVLYVVIGRLRTFRRSF